MAFPENPPAGGWPQSRLVVLPSGVSQEADGFFAHVGRSGQVQDAHTWERMVRSKWNILEKPSEQLAIAGKQLVNDCKYLFNPHEKI